MEHQALYRKYRPRTFEDVCGQDHITSVLKYESEHGTLSHAYLFCGPRGTGKTTCAKILAKAVNCDSPINGDPCGKCYKCTSIDDGSATDVVEMDAASNTGVDYIREIRDEVTYSPAVMRRRVYIIDEVHMLSIGAFNALLKTLEEPPEHVMFILATTEQHKLPATIVSRCQRFDFRRITIGDIANRLAYIAGCESIPLEAEAATIIAKQSQGCMRDAISMFELCSGGGAEVTSERVRDVLGISGIESACRTAAAIKAGDLSQLFRTVGEVASSSKDIAVYWQELISLWRDMLVAKSTRDASDYLDLTSQEAALLSETAALFTTPELIYASGMLDDALTRMTRLPQIKRNIAELTLVRIATPSLTESQDALFARIASLEDRITLLEHAPRAVSTERSNSAPVEKSHKAVSETAAEASKARDEAESDPDPDAVRSDGANTSAYSEVTDKSELLERIGAADPMLRGLAGSARICVSPDGARVAIYPDNRFAEGILSRDTSRKTLSDALALCGIAGVGADVEILPPEAAPAQGSILDELDPGL